MPIAFMAMTNSRCMIWSAVSTPSWPKAALVGVWLAVFALCGRAILDQEYARMLARF